VFAERLAEGLGRAVVVENRTGAGGQIAAEALKAAPPDGNTLLVAPDASITVYPYTVAKPAYDPRTDFIPVAHMGGYDMALGVSTRIAPTTLAEFIDWARRNPGEASYGTAGAGSTLHFLGLMLNQAAGINLTHVPYRGVGPAVTDVSSGQIAAVILPVGTLTAQVAAGKARILATSGARRSPVTPGVPTFRELGYATLDVPGWFGLFAPAGTRPEVVARDNAVIEAAMRTVAIRERMKSLDLEIREMSPAQFAAMIEQESRRWGPIIRASGFSADSQ
jgi:tripartite-type tricarboxylate transporter receptor subunit TctC